MTPLYSAKKAIMILAHTHIYCDTTHNGKSMEAVLVTVDR